MVDTTPLLNGSPKSQRKRQSLAQVQIEAAPAPETPSSRERADVADLERHISRRTSWQDNKTLPPLPNQKHRSNSYSDIMVVLRADATAESRALRQPGGFRRGHAEVVADEKGIPQDKRPTRNTPNLVHHLEEVGLYVYGAALVKGPGSLIVSKDGGATAKGLSKRGCVFTLIKSFIGAGIFFQPAGWRSGGYVQMTLIYPFIGLIATFCGVLLIRTRGNYKITSYGDLMSDAMGRPGEIAANSSIFGLHVGSCCTYIVLVATLAQEVFELGIPVWQMIFISLLIWLPLGLFRDLAKLAPLALFGVFMTFLCIVYVMGYLFMQMNIHPPVWSELIPFRPGSMLVGLGIACFTFESIGCILPIYDATEDKAFFPKAYAGVQVAITCLNATVGLCGYLAFGHGTRSFVFLNLPNDISVMIVKLAFSIHLMGTYALVLIPALRIAEDAVFGMPPVDAPESAAQIMRKTLGRTVIIIFMGVVAVVGSSSLDHFVSLVGAIGGMPLAFMYPAIVHLKLNPDLSKTGQTVDYALIAGGLVLTILITINCFMTWGD